MTEEQKKFLFGKSVTPKNYKIDPLSNKKTTSLTAQNRSIQTILDSVKRKTAVALHLKCAVIANTAVEENGEIPNCRGMPWAIQFWHPLIVRECV